MADGWVRIHRSIFDSDAFGRRQKFSRREAFIWMVSEAAWQDNGRLKKGQLLHSIRHMAEVWKWSKSSVSEFILALQKADTIRTVTRTGRTVITICNYAQYQGDEKKPGHQPVHNPDKTRTSNKKEEEENNKTVDQTEFDQFWNEVPRKIGKGQARRAYNVARKKASGLEILAGMQAFARMSAGKDPKYVCHPATWLNGERWLDEEPRRNGQIKDVREGKSLWDQAGEDLNA